MLVEYYFKIKYIKGIDNIKIDILSRKVELQGSKKLLDTILYKGKDRIIRYNQLKLAAVYKVLEVTWMQKIQKVQEEDLDNQEYKNQEVIYILQNIAEEFIKDFYKRII